MKLQNRKGKAFSPSLVNIAVVNIISYLQVTIIPSRPLRDIPLWVWIHCRLINHSLRRRGSGSLSLSFLKCSCPVDSVLSEDGKLIM